MPGFGFGHGQPRIPRPQVPFPGILTGGANLADWAAARDAAGTVTVLCIGDSVLDGWLYTAVDDTKLITQRLGSLLRAGSGRAAIADTFACRSIYRAAATQNPAWTMVGDTPTGGFGLASISTNLAGTDTATITIPADCSSLDVFYTATTTSGTMEVRVGGVLVDSWATAGASILNARVRHIALTPNASPITVEVKSSSATAVFLDAIYPYYGNETDDVRVLDGSFGGRTATQFIGFDSGTWGEEVVASADPDVILLSIGANDWITNDDNAAAIQADVEALIDKFRVGKANVPVLLLGLYEPTDAQQANATGATYSQYKAAAAAAAASRDAAFLDLRPVIGKLTGSGPYDAGDGLHTNEAGQTAMGNAIAYHLLHA